MSPETFTQALKLIPEDKEAASQKKEAEFLMQLERGRKAFNEKRYSEAVTALEAAAGRPAILAGSGSAYVVPVNTARELPQLVEEVGRRLHVPVVGTTSARSAVPAVATSRRRRRASVIHHAREPRPT